MDFKQLEAFVKVAETKSFTKAAEELNISQPTVSIHIQNLEAEIGVKLFDREGKFANLTPAGNLLLKYAREMMKLREKALLAVREFMGSIEGNFVIGASTVPGEFILPLILSDFTKKYPKTRFIVNISDSEDINYKVAEGILELGIVGSRREIKKLEYTPLFKDEIVLVHPNPEKEEIEKEEIYSLPIITREGGSGTRKTFEKALKMHNINPERLNTKAQLGSTTAVIRATKSGMGYGITSIRAVKEEIEKGELKVVRIKNLRIERWFYLVRMKNRTLPPALSLFVEFLEKQKEQA